MTNKDMKSRPLWSDGKSGEDIEAIASHDSDMVIYNLHEDVTCLRERVAELEKESDELEASATDWQYECEKARKERDGKNKIIAAMFLYFDSDGSQFPEAMKIANEHNTEQQIKALKSCLEENAFICHHYEQSIVFADDIKADIDQLRKGELKP